MLLSVSMLPVERLLCDKTTYQIGGLYYPGGERSERTAASPARAFIQDASYRKTIRTCGQCGWFGLEEDNHDACPFCGNTAPYKYAANVTARGDLRRETLHPLKRRS